MPFGVEYTQASDCGLVSIVGAIDFFQMFVIWPFFVNAASSTRTISYSRPRPASSLSVSDQKSTTPPVSVRIVPSVLLARRLMFWSVQRSSSYGS